MYNSSSAVGITINSIQVNKPVLSKILEWCEHHQDDPQAADDDLHVRKRTDDISEWDLGFMNVDISFLVEIIKVRLPSSSPVSYSPPVGRRFSRDPGPLYSWQQDRRQHD